MAKTLKELLQAYSASIVAREDAYADVRRGSTYEQPGGASAMVLLRVSQFIDDVFDSKHFLSSDGEALDDLALARYEATREKDTRGQGFAIISRSTATAGLLNAHTRIKVNISGGTSKYYRLVSDVSYVSSDVSLKVLIEAVTPGPGSQVDVIASSQFDDITADPWVVDRVFCQEGTTYLPAHEFKAQILTTRKERKVGFPSSILKAAASLGAINSVLFQSDYAGDDKDVGLNMLYVGTDALASTDALVSQIKILLEDVRCLGDNLQVRKITKQVLPITINVYLRDDVSKFNVQLIDRRIRAAVVQYMASNGYTYKRAAIEAKIAQVVLEVQEVDVVAPLTDVVVPAIDGNYPPELTYYQVTESDIGLNILGPK